MSLPPSARRSTCLIFPLLLRNRNQTQPCAPQNVPQCPFKPYEQQRRPPIPPLRNVCVWIENFSPPPCMGGMSWEPRVSIALYCTVLHNAWEYFGEQKMTIGFSIIRISAMHPGLCSPQRKESEHYFATTHSLSPHQLDHSSLPFAIRWWVIVGGEAPPSSFFTSLRGYFCFPLPSKWGQGSKGHIFCQGGPGMSSSSSAGICSACSSVGSMIDFFCPLRATHPPGEKQAVWGPPQVLYPHPSFPSCPSL